MHATVETIHRTVQSIQITFSHLLNCFIHHINKLNICDCRITQIYITLTGSFSPHCGNRNHKMSQHIILHRHYCPHSNSDLHSRLIHLFHRNRCGRCPDSRRRYCNLYSFIGSCICIELSHECNFFGVIQILFYNFYSPWISRKKYIFRNRFFACSHI